ncbi:MAG TPA: ribosome assembly RNA-binding protein YhbY [Kofleriaceae bacterium]|nr:ribosome assembly RNA-binding protein YhbY [Kofleriaceae bacterium]
MALNGKQRRHLRALGHPLPVVAQVGKGGLTASFVEGVDQALRDHELIKVKLLETAALDRHEAADELARRTGAEVAQVLGRTILLYRPDPDEPRITLPRAKA